MTEYDCEITIDKVTYKFRTMAAVTLTQAIYQLDLWLFDEHNLSSELATRLSIKRVAI